MIVWRIEKRRYVDATLSGQGARLYGGRWNSAGRRAVYGSATLSLAALEKLLHLDRPGSRSTFIAVGIEVPESGVTEIDIAALPKNWMAELEFASTRRLGDKWLESGESVAVSVPSAIIPREQNYLLNPEHPDYSRVRVTVGEPFLFDPRLTG